MSIQIKVEQIRSGQADAHILEKEFAKNEVTFGRSSVNDVVLKEPDVFGPSR